MKRIQNKTAESRRTLPTAMLYGTAIWVLAGLFTEQWWLQFACFILSVLLVMRINSKNLLIRIYSRSVSVAFIFLSCAAVFLFPSLAGGIVQLCCIAALMLLFDSYQDQTAVGSVYYAFLFLGLGSMFDAHVIFYLPLLWFMMKIIVYSLCWRTFLASLLGLITPYWLLAGWTIYHDRESFFSRLTQFHLPDSVTFSFGFESLSQLQLAFILFLVFLVVVSSIHFMQKSYLDKIRVRQLYYSFMLLAFYSFLLIFLLPENEGLAVRMLIIATSPLFGHFFALTNSKLSNVTFCILSVATILFTGFYLWTLSYPS